MQGFAAVCRDAGRSSHSLTSCWAGAAAAGAAGPPTHLQQIDKQALLVGGDGGEAGHAAQRLSVPPDVGVQQARHKVQSGDQFVQLRHVQAAAVRDAQHAAHLQAPRLVADWMGHMGSVSSQAGRQAGRQPGQVHNGSLPQCCQLPAAALLLWRTPAAHPVRVYLHRPHSQVELVGDAQQLVVGVQLRIRKVLDRPLDVLEVACEERGGSDVKVR